jgi:hypothetical protein
LFVVNLHNLCHSCLETRVPARRIPERNPQYPAAHHG